MALIKDTEGFAPTTDLMCTDEECQNCNSIGWILCNHEGAEIEYDAYNEDGYHEWCTVCSSPVQSLTWTWCPKRAA